MPPRNVFGGVGNRTKLPPLRDSRDKGLDNWPAHGVGAYAEKEKKHWKHCGDSEAQIRTMTANARTISYTQTSITRILATVNTTVIA